MSGTSGLNKGDFTNINVAYGIGLGDKDNQGNQDQVLISGGYDKGCIWGKATSKSIFNCVGQSATLSTLTPANNITADPSTEAGLTMEMDTIDNFGLEDIIATSTTMNIEITLSCVGVSLANDVMSGWCRLDKDRSGTTGYTATNGQIRPTALFFGLIAYNTGVSIITFNITNLVIGQTYSFIPAFMNYKEVGQTGTDLIISYGSTAGILSIGGTFT